MAVRFWCAVNISGEVKTLAFANFSTALTAVAPEKVLVAAGAGSLSQTGISPSSHSGYRPVVLDYGKQVGLPPQTVTVIPRSAGAIGVNG